MADSTAFTWFWQATFLPGALQKLRKPPFHHMCIINKANDVGAHLLETCGAKPAAAPLHNPISVHPPKLRVKLPIHECFYP
jgi:hypothetical protein